ncbi:methyl-accepting chemotaxis protein [Desulfurivibrio alkaliphilus]|uniref:Methyl-accepting chemotaxis sensory transducer n=1 Tax=Desulfurivibrio alkaliphilus (strain DSM 19089 / UNIQEM U267 / AHT2) TaxID=589865 RepID=D6Z205_DESAT|nr:methyl-accepting chemotaxis protein [Desulfurivibrio alkaliphilus]ADH85580.1 methyl-accepting chemotaxis sensory transducer [Desulfurivibrio alkaliphilus AHT 2]
MGFINSLTIQKRLVLVLAIPLLFLSFILISEARNNFLDLRQARTTLNIADIAIHTANLAHGLQDERTYSDAYLGSRGQQRGNELASTRATIDRSLAELREHLAATGADRHVPELQTQVRQALNALGRLPELRRQVDNFSIGGGDSFVAYAEILAEVRATLQVVSQVIPNQELMRLIAAHYNFLEFVMRLNGERLLMANTFAANEFAPLAFMRFAESLAEQRVYLESFETLADPEIRQYYQDQMNAPAVTRVADLRQVAIDHRFGGGFNVDPNRWLQAVNGKLDLMSQVEGRLIDNYLEHGAAYRSQSLTQLISKLGFGFVIWWSTAIVGAVVIINLVRAFKSISSEIGDGTIQVNSAAHQLAATSQMVADSSSRQAAAVEQTSASMEEMSAMINRDADNALQADALMREANDVLSRADGSMKKLIESMNEISSASLETQKIVKTIDEIAFQTNLLALNAAVEAARAGEAGAGFAVVADEVRNLAMRAAEAAQNTSSLIEGTVQKVQGGTTLVDETGGSFTAAREAVQKIAILLAEIATASREEADAAKQVNEAISHIDSATQENAASAEETASAANELSSQAESIQQRVAELMAMVGKEIETTYEDRSLKRPSSAPPREPSRAALPAQKQEAKPKPPPKQELEPFDDF